MKRSRASIDDEAHDQTVEAAVRCHQSLADAESAHCLAGSVNEAELHHTASSSGAGEVTAVASPAPLFISTRLRSSHCLLTGVNGVGKTALLESIVEYFNTDLLGYQTASNVVIEHDGRIPFVGVLGIVTTGNAGLPSFNKFNETINEQARELHTKIMNSLLNDGPLDPMIERYRQMITAKAFDTSNLHQIIPFLRVVLERERPRHVHVLTSVAKYLSRDDEDLCRRFNEWRSSAGNDPDGDNIMLEVKPTENVQNDSIILDLMPQRNPIIPSPGEKQLLMMKLWLFQSLEASNHNPDSPSVLILDEPDAHLHPSLASAFIKTLRDVIVNKNNIQVIITTHNPTTLSFVMDPKQIFVMDDNNGSVTITPATSFQTAAHRLTEKLVDVYKPSRLVLCEGKDSKYYTFVQDYLFRHTLISSKDGCQLSFRGGANRVNVTETVKAWNKDSERADFDRVVGIVDRDSDGCDRNKLLQSNVHMLLRYTKENYMYDPINVLFGCQGTECGTRIWDQCKLPRGTTVYSLFNDNPGKFQDIVNAVIKEIALHVNRGFTLDRVRDVDKPCGSLIKSILNFQEEDSVLVTILNPCKKGEQVVVQYPRFLIDKSGHELVNLYRKMKMFTECRYDREILVVRFTEVVRMYEILLGEFCAIG